MRAAFISDIHGNSTALGAVLEDIGRQRIDQIYVLGDLCYRGPDPKGSLAMVQSLNTRVIKGNADEWVVRGVLPGEVPDKVIGMMNLERDWTVSKLDRQDIAYLEGLQARLDLEWEGIRVKAFHATPESLFEVVLPSADDDVLQAKLMPAADADVYIYAHIHKPFIRYLNGRILMNIGSVGLPFDGMAKASYGIVEVEQGRISTSIERVGFDIEEVIRQYESGQYPNSEMMARILRSGSVS
ncbi:metallophosphoesterase family protein [Paenibacillus nasutitermitis]|uniref:Serine/threonine protein phosphatase n=1 Tax=Paenibacillus nasutitermitis TaxID=1652958 RepID=A0A917DZF6_9BACL|nr:metallophosphoesterase family protein [Paenibacillus nasutitermitis]GGD82117.1 serine/threonine protein phosphatase [Paenibacillus nasutitermitis]